jgi:hypothetical protein
MGSRKHGTQRLKKNGSAPSKRSKATKRGNNGTRWINDVTKRSIRTITRNENATMKGNDDTRRVKEERRIDGSTRKVDRGLSWLDKPMRRCDLSTRKVGVATKKFDKPTSKARTG